MKGRIAPRLFVDASDNGITEIGLGRKRKKQFAGSGREGRGALQRRREIKARKELNAYFAQRLRSFSSPCDLGTLPRFTRAVLAVAARIPYGEVRSYRWVAKELRKPKAMRAVGNALARNPIPIIIPCHRVVRSDGSLGGYALGLGWKRRLLKLEGAGPATAPRKRRS